MKRSERTEQKWRERVKAFEQSDLTIQKFCAAEGVSTTMFYKWRRRLGVAVKPRARATPKLEFVELGRDRSPAKVELVTKSGVVVRVAPGFDEPTLRRVLEVVRER